jgi:alkylation response protein AidB-like acyl-CoA dehydrogenase
MDLNEGGEYDRFRRAVAEFVRTHWDTAYRGDHEAECQFRREAVSAGYLYRSVPRKYGGAEQEFDGLKSRIIKEEFTRAKAPMEGPGPAPGFLVPTLVEWGSDWQKERFVPRAISGEDIWCQGYSEPEAGSDLSSLRTRAVLDGDEWVINGQKIWTSEAHRASYIFCLARTEPDVPKREGISYLLVPMKQPGIDVRPLRQITGSYEFCEVFLTDARTPRDHIVGARGQGWTVANTTLRHERAFQSNIGFLDSLFASLVKLAQRAVIDGRPAIEDPRTALRLVELQGWLEAQRCSSYLQLSRAANGAEPGPTALMNKLAGTEFGHRVAELAIELIGDHALLSNQAREGEVLGDERWINQIFGSLGNAISAGTSNIQRNIIAERVYGLPRDLQQ